jgi:hypothetical protein
MGASLKYMGLRSGPEWLSWVHTSNQCTFLQSPTVWFKWSWKFDRTTLHWLLGADGKKHQNGKDQRAASELCPTSRHIESQKQHHIPKERPGTKDLEDARDNIDQLIQPV